MRINAIEDPTLDVQSREQRRNEPMAEKFERFHADNPNVYDVLVYLARQWITKTGKDRLGVQCLYERARWELAVTTNDAEYRLNNSYTPYYARLMMLQEPDFVGLFELRKAQADDWAEGMQVTKLAVSEQISTQTPRPMPARTQPHDAKVIAISTARHAFELKRVTKTEILLTGERCSVRFPFTYEGTLKARNTAQGKKIRIEPRLKAWIRTETDRRKTPPDIA